ncbi:aquaporin-like protein [Thozetella sp. PMI_491]|nr:aquaporin-like protein [Thozetella sp. PMI_491]
MPEHRDPTNGLHPLRTNEREGRLNVYTDAQPITHRTDGAFDGSFGGTARANTVLPTAPWYRRREYFASGWSNASIWRAAVMELIMTALLCYLSGQFGMTLMGSGVQVVAAYVGIYNAVFLAVFIYAAIPASGGHLNPFITFTTFLLGLCPLPRAVLYICAQTAGGALAGGLLLGSWGRERAVQFMGGGCFFDPSIISPGQVLLTEIMSSWVLIFLAIGVGLDPRQQLLFGPQLGPILVGLSLGLVTSATTGIAPGFTGANMMPARALALAVARGNFDYHWIWWVGPAIASVLTAPVYAFAPPYHAEEPIGST